MTYKPQGSENAQRNSKVREVFERVMPNRTITGKKTDKPQFPSRTDGMDRAIVRRVSKFLKLEY